MAFFTVLESGSRTPREGQSQAYLITDNWDDWFKYSTLYALIIFDEDGERHSLGGVKIGQFSMREDQRRPDILTSFDELDDRFFSLGQDDSYYDGLNSIGGAIRDKVLVGLRDVARDPELFARALMEDVTGTSLLRSVRRATVSNQYRRMAMGGARLTRYEFAYQAPERPRSKHAPLALAFVVEPESFPPTNIHVLISRNGVGKTTLLENMTRCIVEKEEEGSSGCFSHVLQNDFDEDSGHLFTNLVSVTFSAFDPFDPLPERRDRSEGVQYSYVGLKRVGRTVDGKPLSPKTPEKLSAEFGKSVEVCRQGARAERWRRALEMLEADPIFRDAAVADLASDEYETEEVRPAARKLFGKLSSGHKIVLLTITRLVETVEEKTLVLLDEPEAHLHPPLLSAFVRSLSDLLINRNGVALVATHSPVVLQEVPKSCVWKIRRSGTLSVGERPDIQTFGENVGVLTREVFGLEVTQSGFHKMLDDAVDEQTDFESVVEKFGGELGGEARALVRALVAARQGGGSGAA